MPVRGYRPGAQRCAHAYVLSSRGARSWLQRGALSTGEVDRHFSWLHEHRHQGDFHVDFVEPPLFCQRTAHSPKVGVIKAISGCCRLEALHNLGGWGEHKPTKQVCAPVRVTVAKLVDPQKAEVPGHEPANSHRHLAINAAAPAFSVAVQVNGGYVDMFCNWLRNFRSLQLTSDVWALAYGDNTYVSVKRLLGSSGHVVKANATIDGFHTFNSHLFNKLALDKIRLMKDVLDATKQAVVFTDIDTG